ncbi:rhomboid family intramembrane serine protease [Neorhizobium petrolearium]|uniref:rhomboid family intramembrane serine protease n=1 Tax=Neorhizobium petrolearium TaxID=515361 RepID=UPI001AE25D10|nr:rhomboid family intramembrane serine protease [Neorhizobium petrolearium]
MSMNDGPGIADEQREMDEDDQRSPPVFNLPRSLVVTLALLAAIYIVQEYLLDDDTRAYFVVNLAFTPLRYAYPLEEQGFAWLWTPVTYSLLHGSIEHILFNALWLMAFGAPVVRRIGTLRYVVFWVLSAAAAAFFHAMINWGNETLLIGASGVVSALMGAACRFAFPPGRGYDRTHGHLYPRQSIPGAFRSRTVVIFTAMWFIGNLLIAFGVTLFGADMGPIAWDAHIGGFLFGFLLFGFFDPVSPSRRPLTQP